MKLFGFEISRTKRLPNSLQSVASGGWRNIIRESYAGAWQQNVELNTDTILTFSTVYSCISLIASDIAKLRIKLVELDSQMIWKETRNPSYTPVLRKPNSYQTRIQFINQWIISKLLHGNTYVLKRRDERSVVTELYVLDPMRVRPMIADNGEVFYELRSDKLSELFDETLLVPASEIIHDLMNPLYHPLVGIGPLTASGLAAVQGLRIQNNSAEFFKNGSKPGGILSAPGEIGDETATRLATYFNENFTGTKSGRVAVIGDGLKYEQMAIPAVDAQLIEQLKWSSEMVCSTFHVPPYMVGVGPAPPYTNVEALWQQYYSQCLQILIESIELLLDEGLRLSDKLGTELDLSGLLRMDTATQYKTIKEGINGGFLTPNEGRLRINLPPLEGGDTVYLQQQNFSIEALAKRDAEDPFAAKVAALPDPVSVPDDPEKPEDDAATDDAVKDLIIEFQKGLIDA